MPVTEKFTLNLETEVMQKMRAMVDSGQYASMNDLVENVLINVIARDSDDPERTYWFHKEVARRCHEADANPELGLSNEDICREVTEEFKEARRQRDLQAKSHA